MNRAERRRQQVKTKQEFNSRSIEIINAKPPVWDSLCKLLGAAPMNAVFTYGDKIYNPSGVILCADVIEHEKIHMAQQDYSIEGAELWWGKFLRDVDFRIEQEARAYGRQYAFLCKTLPDKPRKPFLTTLAKMLSGLLYQECIGLSEAMKKIEEYSEVR